MNWKDQLDALIKKVEAIPAIKTSINTLLTGIASIATTVAGDATATAEFANSLKDNSAKAADAVVANTPKTTA